MKIYFTWAIKWGRENQPQFEYIVRELKKYGTVFSQHVASDEISQYGETNISSSEILMREIKGIMESDVIVADVSTPSLWVGYLLHLASSQSKKIIALYQWESTLKLSSIIKADTNIKVYTYKGVSDIEEICREVF